MKKSPVKRKGKAVRSNSSSTAAAATNSSKKSSSDVFLSAGQQKDRLGRFQDYLKENGITSKMRNDKR